MGFIVLNALPGEVDKAACVMNRIFRSVDQVKRLMIATRFKIGIHFGHVMYYVISCLMWNYIDGYVRVKLENAFLNEYPW